MGIRFDRDSRRATNGPIIFFSIYHDEAFEEEIRSAFLSGLSFYAYRFPNDSMLSYGSSEGYVEGLGTPGFVIGFFSPDKPFITIPYDRIKRKDGNQCFYTMPAVSTTFSEYSNEVGKIVNSIHGGKAKKIVASRVIVKDTNLDIAEKFYDLCERFPESFVFCFSTPATGCWIGASPELLLESTGGELNSMALAGTREAGAGMPWDEKNIEEQKIVEDYILSCLIGNGLSPVSGNCFTKSTGSIEHICTLIKAKINPVLNLNLDYLLRQLSPTPALCGFPKDYAMKMIGESETFDRGCYGGFCGPFHNTNDFHLNVVLRCASVSQKRFCVYVGGGITALSNPEEEWRETELKAFNIFPGI